jgi:holo-[acyl-carrier protein] synthase
MGVDIVDIRRIENLITRYGEYFLTKVYSAAERLYCEKMARSALHFAGRWAAKEAFYKALPETCQAISSWQSIEIVPSPPKKQPIINILDPQLLAAMQDENIATCFVTISHEKEYCVANVLLESGAN